MACGDFHTSGRTLASPEATSSGGQEGQRGAVGSATRCPSFCRGWVGGVQTTLETPSSSSQSPLDTLIESGKDRPFHLGPQRRGGTRPPSQDPKKILKSVQSSGLPKGSPISSRQPERAPPHARGSSQKPKFTRPCTACPPPLLSPPLLPLPLPHSAPSTQASSLFLQLARHGAAPGPLSPHASAQTSKHLCGDSPYCPPHHSAT